jgi:hypothetical protein
MKGHVRNLYESTKWVVGCAVQFRPQMSVFRAHGGKECWLVLLQCRVVKHGAGLGSPTGPFPTSPAP